MTVACGGWWGALGVGVFVLAVFVGSAILAGVRETARRRRS